MSVALPVPPAPPLIVIVDESPETRSRLESLLKPLGVTIRGYDTGTEFLASLPDGSPSCAIIEAHLPDMAGVDLMHELKRRDVHNPDVMLATEPDIDGAIAAIRSGAYDFVEKPFLNANLVTRIAGILRRAHEPT